MPDFSGSFPNIRDLDISEQKQDGHKGLSGIIPESLTNLQFLSTLNLAGNSLSGSLSPLFGNMEQMKELDLSDNQLGNGIPPELGKLSGQGHLFISLWF